MNKGLAVISIVIALSFPGAAYSFGENSEIIYPTVNKEIKILQSDSGLTTNYLPDRIYFTVLIFIIGVGGTCLYLYRKGKFPLTPQKKDERLKLCETRMLGNKQFLVVVEYERQKMLLGVGPGTISHLCYLGAHGVEEFSLSKSLEINDDA